MTLEYRGIPIVIALLLAGCVAVPSDTLKGSFSSHKQPPLFEVDPLFTPGLNVLGLNQPEARGSWHTENWILLGVKVSHGDSQDVWLVRLSTLRSDDEDNAPESREFIVPFGMGGVKTGAKFNAPVGKLLVELFDQNGTPQRSSIRTIPHVQSSATLLDVMTHSSPRPRSLDAALHDEIAKAVTIIQMMGGARALVPIREAIRDHVIKRPSLIAVMLSGFRIKLEANIDRNATTRWSEGSGDGMQREEARFPLLLAGQRLFDCRVVTGGTGSPFNLTAGTLMVEAVNPQDAKHRLTVCVLAAKHAAATTHQLAKQ